MPSSSTVPTRRLRAVCLVLVVLGLLAATVAVALRIKAERSSRAVDLVLDYNEVTALAGLQDVPIAQALMEFQAKGATGIALQEETLDTLEAQGALTIAARPMMEAGHYPKAWQGDEVFSVETPDVATNDLVAQGLSRVYPADNVKVERPVRILIHGSRELVSTLGLGLSPVKVGQITKAGLRVMPRLHGTPWTNGTTLEKSVKGIALALLVPPDAPTRGIVIFDGDTLPGYHDLIPRLADLLTENGLVYGAVELAKQKGDAELGRRLDGRLVRVHSIPVLELATMTRSQAVQRFTLAVKDRNIRVLFVHLPPLAADSPLQDAENYVGAVTDAVRGNGYPVSVAKMAHPFSPLSVPAPLLTLIFTGAGAGLLLWVLTVLPTTLPTRGVRVMAVILVLGILVAVGTALKVPGAGRMLFGLLAAIGFPLLALTYAYHRVDALAQQRPRKALLPALVALLVATGITLGGALLVAAMMAESRYLVKVGQFTGVKLALAAPLLLFGVLIVTDGVARAGEDLAAYVGRLRDRLRGFFAQPVYLWGILLALTGLILVALVLARSGNDSGVGVSGSELHMRASLEQLLIARPRTKEFAFGVPLFLLAIVAAARGQRTLALALLLGGAIGLTDVLNTYCHAHTPVLLSLLRTFNGLWLGVIIGIAVLAVLGWLTPRKDTAKQPVPR